MSAEEQNTFEEILKAAKEEFLENGFQRASLRRIVKNAGVTTGAFYGYFKNKEELFSALVEPTATEFIETFLSIQRDFAVMSADEQAREMSSASGSGVDWMVEYAYGHFDEFKLLICAADGTSYSDFVHRIVAIETEYTYHFIDVLKNGGYDVITPEENLMHILVSTLFDAFFEFIIHDMPKSKAMEYIHTLRDFYTAGWNKILCLPQTP